MPPPPFPIPFLTHDSHPPPPSPCLAQDITYATYWEWLNCLESNPCRGWMNGNATFRNATTQRAWELNAEVRSLSSPSPPLSPLSPFSCAHVVGGGRVWWRSGACFLVLLLLIRGGGRVGGVWFGKSGTHAFPPPLPLMYSKQRNILSRFCFNPRMTAVSEADCERRAQDQELQHDLL